MALQTFNETFLPNAKVPVVGSKAGSGQLANYDTRTNATGMPKGVQSFDPAGSPKVDRRNFEAPIQSANPGGTAKFTPSAVDTFTDHTV